MNASSRGAPAALLSLQGPVSTAEGADRLEGRESDRTSTEWGDAIAGTLATALTRLIDADWLFGVRRTYFA